MYELLVISGLGLLTLRSFTKHKEELELLDESTRFRNRMGKLWEIVHHGMRENRLLRAEKALLTILKIDEKNAAAYNRLGILYAKQREFKDAIDCFEIACSIEPTASSLHNLGLIYYETENYEKAVTAFEEALKLEADVSARHIALAKALEHIGQEKRMVGHLERAAELDPNREVYILLIEAYKKLGIEHVADQYADKLKSLKIKAAKVKKRRIRRPKRVVV